MSVSICDGVINNNTVHHFGWSPVGRPLTPLEQAAKDRADAAILKAQQDRFKEVQDFNKPKYYYTNKVQNVVYITNTVTNTITETVTNTVIIKNDKLDKYASGFVIGLSVIVVFLIVCLLYQHKQIKNLAGEI